MIHPQKEVDGNISPPSTAGY